MNIEYLRTSRKSYMIVKKADYIFENYELQMILHNDIGSLLELQVIVGDGVAEYWYDVTGMQSLEKQLTLVPVREKQLRFLLQNIIEMKREMEEYLLDDQNICFSSSVIFYDRFSERIRFCYIPGLGQTENNRGIRLLFEDILQHLDHSDLAAVQMAYDIYERSMQSDFIAEDCIECLTNHVSGDEKKIFDGNYERNAGNRNGVREIYGGMKYDGAAERQTDDYAEMVAEEKPELEFLRPEIERKKGHRRKRRREKRKDLIDYSEILDEEQRNYYAAEEIQKDSYTECFLDHDAEVQWELIYKGDGLEQDLSPQTFPFLIGTDEKKVQGVLLSRVVSRIHARLYLKENKLYLEDYNSTNGTYINQRLIPMNTPEELKPGDRVTFATEAYEVHCRRIPRRD